MSDLIEMGSEYEDGNGDKWRILCIDGYDAGYPVVAQNKVRGAIRTFTRSGVYHVGITHQVENLKKVEPCKYVVVFEYCSRIHSIPAEVKAQQGWGKWVATVKYKVGQDDSEN